MKVQAFIVLGEPQSQGRHRTRAFVAGGRAIAQTYEAKKDKVNKVNIRAQVVNQNPVLYRGDGKGIMLSIIFVLPRPKNHYGKKGNLLPSAPKDHTTKPDLDNLVKAIMDALTGICWEDDKQISAQIVVKSYVDEGYPVPQTVIKVSQDD